MIGSLLATDPDLGPSVLFGARALSYVERRFTERVLGAWKAGMTSLRTNVDQRGPLVGALR